MIDNRNLILAIGLSLAILLGFEFFFPKPKPVTPPEGAQLEQSAPSDVSVPNAASAPQVSAGNVPAPAAIPGSIPDKAQAAAVSRSAALATAQRVRIETPRLSGSLSLKGGRIDDLTMMNYSEELDPTSPKIILLSPEGSENAYFADFGWSPQGNVAVPNDETLWEPSTQTLTAETPVTLSWDNGQGQTFKRTYAIDENFMFTVTQSVVNNGSQAVSLFPYGLVSRHGTPEVSPLFVLHEGMLGVFDDTLKEVDYDELVEDGKIEQDSTGGWLGITDKYWLVALAPDAKTKSHSRFFHRLAGNVDRYQADYLGTGHTIQPGASTTQTTHMFAGAKEVKLLDGYEEEMGIARFDLAIDFGWFYFLTKPIFYAMIFINDVVGNFGVAILLLTVAFKLLFYPLANKSYVAMSKMRKLQPEMTKLRERFGDDKMRLNQEMMAMYKREKANPASGCLPMLVQIPVFFSLYKVLFVTIEMRHAPFFGWIQDLSAPDPTSMWNLFGLIPWDPSTIMPDMLNIGIWPLIMGISMWLQQKLNPQPADPMQAKIFLMLPIMFTFMLATFPAGLVIYWAWNNTLSIIQQKVIMIRMGVK